MTSAEAVNSVYESAKKAGLTVSNIKIKERRNERGYYTYLEVVYVAPGEANESPLSVVSCKPNLNRIETPEDFRNKFIEKRGKTT